MDLLQKASQHCGAFFIEIWQDFCFEKFNRQTTSNFHPPMLRQTLLAILGTALLTATPTTWAQSSQKFGTVRGSVRDASTGGGAPFIQIIVQGTTYGSQADSLGGYIIEKAPVGYHRLEFVGVGFKPYITDPIMITTSVTQVVDAVLKPESAEIESIVVSGSRGGARRIETPPLSVFQLSSQEIERSPGGNRDISKVVQNIPGVAATPSYRNDLIVRGGGPNENKFYLDRIELPIINHFAQQGASGGNVSIINSDFLSTATLYTSAFPASATGSLSSVLDMRMAEGNSEKFKVRAAIGASDFGLTLDSPIGKKVNFIASYRISYLQFLFSALKLPFLPTYQDAQFKLSYHITPKDHLYIIGLGTVDYNRLNTTISDPTPSNRYLLDYLPENDQWSYVAGAVYNHYGDRGQLTAVISTDALDNSLQKWQNNDPSQGKNLDYRSRETQYKARVEYTADLGRGYSLMVGAGYTYATTNNSTHQRLSINNTTVTNDYSSRLDLSSYAFYVTADKSYFKEKLRVTISMRGEANSYNRAMSNPLENLSPRIGLSYAFAPKWQLNFAAGRYFQAPAYTTMGYRDTTGVEINRDFLRYISSDQLSLGVAWTPTPLSRLSVEGFIKWYDKYPMSLRDSVPIGGRPFEVFAVGAEPVRQVGKGRAYGLEILYRNSDLWGFRLNVSLTFYRSEFHKLDLNFDPTGAFEATNWDFQRLLTLVLSRDLGRGWEAGLRWRYAGGAPYTPYDVAASMDKSQWDATHQPVLDYSLRNTARLAPFHQLDIRVDKNWYFKKWTIGIYLDIQNLYNFRSATQELLLPQIDPTTGKYVVGPDGNYIPTTYAGGTGGTIIPTFGVNIRF